MALQKQVFDIKFTEGVDNSDDPKLVIPSKFTRLENVELTSGNTFRRRGGYTAATLTALANSPAVSNIRALQHYEDEILLEADTGLHAFAQNRTMSRNGTFFDGFSYFEKTFERTTLTLKDIASSTQDQYNFDAAQASPSGLQCWVWTEIRLGATTRTVYYKIVDSANNVVLQSGVVANPLSADDAFNPRVVVRDFAGASTFYIYYAFTTGGVSTIRTKAVVVASGAVAPGALSSEHTSLAVNATGVFDAWYSPTSDYVLLGCSDGAGNIKIARLTGTTGYTVSASASNIQAVSAISVATVVNNGTAWDVVAFHDGTDIFVYRYDGTTATRSTHMQFADTGGVATGWKRLAVTPSPFESNVAFVFFDYTYAGVFGNSVGCKSIKPSSAAVSTPTAFADGVVLAARPASYLANSTGLADMFVPVALLSDLQPTTFVLKFGGAAFKSGMGGNTRLFAPRVLARILPGESGDLKARWAASARMPTPLDVGQVSIRLPISRLGKTIIENGANNTPSRLAMATLTTSLPLGTVEAQQSLFMPGGCPMQYDGDRVHEAGFNYYPEGITLTAQNVGGGLTIGAYYVCVVYEWDDARGVRHRSAPSVPVGITLVGGEDAFDVVWPQLTLTDKQFAGDTSTVRAVVYRTVVNPSGGINAIYYRDTPTYSATYSAWGYGNAGARCLTADAALIGNELLYTTGGGLENEAFPSTGIACLHQRRLFMVGLDNELRYTDEIDERFLAPAANEVYRIAVPTTGGKITGLASMDEKLIVFCERQIFYVFGEGPNRLGQQNSYSLPQLATSQMGAMDGTHLAIALTPEGLWFMSGQRGLRLLTRGLQIAMTQNKFVGQEADSQFVAAFNGIKAVALDSRSQVRWYLSGAAVVVWDYSRHQWSTFTNHTSSGGAVSARNLFWHSDAASLFYESITADGTDAGAVCAQVYETAWIALSGIQGFQRVYKLQLLMQAVGNAQVQIEVGYDYSDTYSAANKFTYRHTAGSINPLQIEHALIQQKCEAVRFRITATPVLDATVIGVATVPFTADVPVGQIAVGDQVGGLFGATGFVTYLPDPATGTMYFSFLDSPIALGETLINNTAYPSPPYWSATAGGNSNRSLLLAGLGTAPTVGQLITGQTSGATATTGAVATISFDPDYRLMAITGISGTFIAGELITINSLVEGARLTGMSLSVGVKGGLNRLPAAKRF